MPGSVCAPAPDVTSPLLDREQFFTRWSELHGGYDARTGSVLVRGWLAVVLSVARPLAWVPPTLLTAKGVLVAGIACWAAGFAPALAGLLVLMSAFIDGLDGAVAVLTGRDSRFGFVLDSVADRVADALFLLALWRAGAPPGACVAAGGAVGLLEYTRARAAAAGMSELGVVTVGERPMRVAACAVALLAAPAYSHSAAVGTWLLLGLGAAGFVQLLAVVRSRLPR